MDPFGDEIIVTFFFKSAIDHRLSGIDLGPVFEGALPIGQS